MRKIIFLLLAASAFLASCGTTRLTPEEEQARKARVARAVNTLDMTINITEAYRGRTFNGEYKIYLDGRHITTRLPYFGQVRYGGISELMGEGAVLLENAEIYNIHLDRSEVATKGMYLLSFQAKRDIRTIYTFNISVFDNGQADIILSTTNKTSMRYLGELSFQTP